MLTASVVLYKHTFDKIKPLLESVLLSNIERFYIIDQSEDERFSLEEAIGEFFGNRESTIVHHYFKLENRGYGPGHNMAIRKAKEVGSDYHLVVNPDIKFPKEVMPFLTTYLDENEDVGQIMPKVHYPNGELQRLCKLLPTPMDMFGRLCMPKFYMDQRTARYELADSGYDKVMNVPYLSGCFMLFRISAFVEVGMFDERFFMYAEDIDITRRIHARYKTIFHPAVKITHIHNRADRRSFWLLMVHIINVMKYFCKWGWFFDSERTKFNEAILEEIKGY